MANNPLVVSPWIIIVYPPELHFEIKRKYLLFFGHMQQKEVVRHLRQVDGVPVRGGARRLRGPPQGGQEERRGEEEQGIACCWLTPCEATLPPPSPPPHLNLRC